MIRSVCIISREFPPETAFGGIARVADMEARALAAAGIDVHVISLAPSGQPSSVLRDGIAVHRVPELGVALPGDMPYVGVGLWSHVVAAKYRELDERIQFDVVRAQDYYAEALHLTKRPETPLVVQLHGLSSVISERSGRERSPGELSSEALELVALRRADAAFAASQLVIDETRALLGDNMPETALLGLPFDASRFDGEPIAGEPGAPLRCLFVGRLETNKGPALALRAVAAARARGLDIKLTLLGRDVHDVGGSHRRTVLIPLMQELGLDWHSVRFVEELDEQGVARHLRASDCAVLPSSWESFHAAAVEAIASGVPVIGGENIGLASWLGEEEGLKVLLVDDPDRFAELAADTLTDRSWLESARQRGAARVRELFNPAEIAKREIELFDRLVSERRPAAPVASAPAPDSRLGIVVLAHNALEYTQRAITSILSHTDPDFTVYVVDNASTDATPEWVGGLEDPRVRLLRSEENLGVSGGRNVGIAAALADGVDHVVFLDNDVEVYAGWTQPFLEALDAFPEAGIAGERGVRLHFHAHGRNEESIAGGGPQQADMVVGFCMFMRAKAVRQIGRFDENLGLFWHDDDDYCLRAKRLGYGVLHIGSRRLIHFEHKSSSEIDGIWESAEKSAPSELSAQNQRYLATKWLGDQRRQGIEDARSFVALVFADEVAADPSLLAGWGQHFSGNDDATLAIYTGDTPVEQIVSKLESAVAEAGLDGDDAPDLVIVQGGESVDAAIAGSLDGVLTRRDPQGIFQAPPHFDESTLDELRAVAERRWSVRAPQAV